MHNEPSCMLSQPTIHTPYHVPMKTQSHSPNRDANPGSHDGHIRIPQIKCPHELLSIFLISTRAI